MGSNVVKELHELKLYFNNVYDKDEDTIDDESYQYITRNVFELIRELKHERLNIIYKMMIKNQLQSLGLKVALAKRTHFNPFTNDEGYAKILKHFNNHKEAKIIGFNKQREYIVVTKHRDMNRNTFYMIKVEKIKHITHSVYQTGSQISFEQKLEELCKNTNFKSYDHFNQNHVQ